MIYLDNSATTCADPAVVEKVAAMMGKDFGNPSSLHGKGAKAYMELGTARNQIAKMLGAHTSRIYFTSGATESNNLAIQGGARANQKAGKHVVTTAIEHESVLAASRHLECDGWEVTCVYPDPMDHRIHAEDVVAAVREDTALVSVMYVNNETGEILPVREITEVSAEKIRKPAYTATVYRALENFPLSFMNMMCIWYPQAATRFTVLWERGRSMYGVGI